MGVEEHGCCGSGRRTAGGELTGYTTGRKLVGQKKLAHDVKETRMNEGHRSMQLAAKFAPQRIFASVKQVDRLDRWSTLREQTVP
ncbi:hypothetical protein DIPPA_11088 [Diplonema papillatum]|nr:hypothetical protein DIPPA_11088 [Diplonema papillatum]